MCVLFLFRIRRVRHWPPSNSLHWFKSCKCCVLWLRKAEPQFEIWPANSNTNVRILCLELFWMRRNSHWESSNQRSGSMTFWSGSGSTYPCLRLIDPDPTVDPAIISSLTFKTPTKNFFSAYYFLKIHLHLLLTFFSRIKRYQEVTNLCCDLPIACWIHNFTRVLDYRWIEMNTGKSDALKHP